MDVTPPPRQCTPPLENAGALSTAKTTAQKEEEEAPRESTVTTSLFQSLDQTPSESSEEEFDSDADLDLGRVNENWAKLKVELESLKALSGASKGKGKKNKSGPQLETPEMHKVRTKMTKLEKDYMFSRKDAGKSVRYCPADCKTLFSRSSSQNAISCWSRLNCDSQV